MAETTGTSGTQGRVPPEHANVDWERAEHSPEFQELVKKRRNFVVPATIFFLAWFLGFILLAGYARDFMGEKITGGLTVGYVLALTQFVMTWTLGAMYLRRADREFDPLARRAAQVALHEARDREDAGLAGDADGGPAGRPRADEEVRP